MNDPLWQTTSARPWPDQVNEILSRHGHGLEEQERTLDAVLQRLTELEAAIGMLNAQSLLLATAMFPEDDDDE